MCYNAIKIECFLEIIKNVPADYIVKLAYRYLWEEDYTISNELLLYEYSTDSYEWVNDWNEGQHFVYVVGFIKVSDVIVPEWKGVL